MGSLDPRMQDLLDRQAILDCLNRYCMGVDRHDSELLISAFHADAVDGNMYAAIDALVDKLDRMVKKRKDMMTDHHATEGRSARQ